MRSCVLLLCALAVGICADARAVPASARTQSVPAEWGPVWQAVLPAQERHPSLFYDDKDRARMAERIGHEPWSRWWKAVDANGPRTQAAVRWWLLGDEKDAVTARDDLLKNPIWRETPHGYLEPSSHRFADYVAAYDVLAAWPGLNAGDRKTMRDRIAAEADHYYTALETVAGGRNYGNQRTLAASALGMAALALCEYRDSPNGPAKWLERALYEIRRDENFWFFRPDGLFVEGVGYTTYMNVQFVPFAIAYERATGKYLFEDPRLRDWLVFACYQVQANGDVVPWGTCEAWSGLPYLCLLSNERYGRDLAPLFRQVFNLPAAPSPHLYHMHIALSLYDEVGRELFPASEVLPGRESFPAYKSEPPGASHAFPKSQTVVLRENWGHETVAAWFAGKDGTWPLSGRYDTYSHGDAGSFVIAAWDEVLAADSGYDHWQSHDYYGAEFHNVILIDGKGPAQDTPGEMTNIEIDGAIRHATVTCAYQGCVVKRILALIRGRYVLVFDRIAADKEHDASCEHEYTWQVRSTWSVAATAHPPESAGTKVGERDVTWPGLSSSGWMDLKPGKTMLTTVAPPFAKLAVEPGRWRPRSAKPEFKNQVARAKWRAGSTTALFALIPNLSEHPDVAWKPAAGQNLIVSSPIGTDQIIVEDDRVSITSEDGTISYQLH